MSFYNIFSRPITISATVEAVVIRKRGSALVVSFFFVLSIEIKPQSQRYALHNKKQSPSEWQLGVQNPMLSTLLE
jgi:hypothetical protein